MGYDERGRLFFFLNLTFPVVGEELVDFVVGVGWDFGEEIAEVGEGINFVALGALDEAVESGGGVASAFAAGEEPVFASDGQRADGAFGGVVVDGEVAVFEVAGKRRPVVEGVGAGFADGAFGEHGGVGFFYPGLECFDVGLGEFFASREECVYIVSVFSGIRFDTVKFFDAAHGFVSEQGVGAACIEIFSSGVGPTSGLNNSAVKIESVVTGIGVALQKALILFFFVIVM